MDHLGGGGGGGGDAASSFYLLSIHVTELNVDKTLRVHGDLHLGGVMFRLVESIAVTADWSDHALWWPEKKVWLAHSRATLNQCGIFADAKLEFTPMHKTLRVQLPDLQVLDLKVNFSVNVFNAVLQLAKELGIRHPEELSLLRRADKGGGKGGESGLAKDSTSASLNGISKRGSPAASSLQAYGSLQRSASHGASSPATPGSLRNPSIPANSPQSTMLRRSGGLLSPGSPASWNGSATSPLQQQPFEFSDSSGNPVSLVHSPQLPSKDAFQALPRFKSFADRALINAGWLNSSKSLMEQGCQESELVQLRFKYYNFYDLNPKYDAARVNQIYEQAKWQLISEEVECTEEEMMMFAALQLQIYRQLQEGGDEVDGLRENDSGGSGGGSGGVADDVDVALRDLQLQLEGSSSRLPGDITHLPVLQGYFRHFKPKKYAIRGTKRLWFMLRDTRIDMYTTKETQEDGEQPLGSIELHGCEVQPQVNIAQQRFIIKLFLSTGSSGSGGGSDSGQSEEWLKCDNANQYARWMAACRLASKGHTMADASYGNEVQAIDTFLSMQRPQAPSQALQASSVEIDPADYVAPRFCKKYKPKQIVQKIIEAHANVRDMSLSEAKMHYIKAWQALPEYGISYFLVKFTNHKKEELLGVAFNRMMVLDAKKGDVLKTYRFKTLKTWNVQWEIKEMTVEFDEEKLAFRCLSTDLKMVHEFIGGYIFLDLRSQDKSQTLNEDMFHKLTGGSTSHQ